MPLVRTADLVADAVAAGTGVAAFNVITLEHAEAIAAGSEQANRPAILQLSQNCARFHGGDLAPICAAATAVAEASTAPLALHLDHIEDDELFRRAVQLGVSSAMYDASGLDYAGNVEATRHAAGWAHAHGLMCEAELGRVGGKQGAHEPGVRTDPEEAAGFVAATGVDALAVAVGSSHAMTDRSAELDLALIGRLRDAVPVPLVLHGSSGVPDPGLTAAVGAGMVKINIGTALNAAFTEQVRQVLAADEKLVDPRRYVAPGREAMAATVAHLLEVVGATG
ncbi:MAG: class II fructose-bisphosphate aldolase [Nocardioidaceae bacterium]